jgi:hypothetical protein
MPPDNGVDRPICGFPPFPALPKFPKLLEPPLLVWAAASSCCCAKANLDCFLTGCTCGLERLSSDMEEREGCCDCPIV